MNIKSVFTFEDLACKECTHEVIKAIENRNDVEEVYIDFDKKCITIVGSRKFTFDEVNEVVQNVRTSIHNKHQNFNSITKLVTDVYSFEDIDCPNCCAKVEKALNNNENIAYARVNYLTKKIIIKHKENYQVFNIVTKIVKSAHKDAKVYKTPKHLNKNVHKCSCCDHHHHEHEHQEKNNVLKKIILILGVILYITSIILYINNKSLYVSIMFYISYICISYNLFIDAIRGIIHKDFFSEATLMIVASLGAVIIGEYIEGIMVILLFRVGEYCQDKAKDKSSNEILKMLELKVDEVTLQDGRVKKVEDVKVGETIRIKVGERIPLDGKMLNDFATVDMKALTGESQPLSIHSGEEILSGAINLTKVIDIEVTKIKEESTMNKVLQLVEEASNQKSKSEKFITKFARIYTPVILLIALITSIIQFILKVDFEDVCHTFFTTLVISCPCALVISIPLSYFSGIGRASSDGILVKGGNYLEALTNTKTIVLDKTGTITKGNFKVLEIVNEENITKEEIIKYLTKAEKYSLHPIAQSIINEFGERETSKNAIVEEIPGEGVKLTENDEIILSGNDKLLDRYNINYKKSNSIHTTIYLAVNGKYYGYVTIGDEIKETSYEFFDKINGKYKTVMLTGDNELVALEIKDKLNIDSVFANLLPNDKYEKLKEIIENKNGNVIYVGDGINDSPSLKLSDVGIAMGLSGTDSAKEASDIVIMNDDLNKVTKAIEIATITKKIVKENIIFALSIKLLALVIGITGILDSFAMLIAIMSDVGACLLCILNCMRIMKYKKQKENIK